ncbi:MAG: MmcQ/YjbR family DNA-binding protein [Methanomassiliicoccaceae archaeon]|jgi:predicted DNA-binding protein (MmcQ/YjbR family)|nr:MmcQ/YjbR family DNA-binding protein [Methanomassiliicoccaceae archaeon]
MMRGDVFSYVKERYGVDPDHPWERTPDYAILRHTGNRKWFAAIVDTTEDKIGIDGVREIDALLLKCDPSKISSLIDGRNILPAYTMSKEHWITVVLGTSMPASDITKLIDLSYELTKPKGRPLQKKIN